MKIKEDVKKVLLLVPIQSKKKRAQEWKKYIVVYSKVGLHKPVIRIWDTKKLE